MVRRRAFRRLPTCLLGKSNLHHSADDRLWKRGSSARLPCRWGEQRGRTGDAGLDSDFEQHRISRLRLVQRQRLFAHSQDEQHFRGAPASAGDVRLVRRVGDRPMSGDSLGKIALHDRPRFELRDHPTRGRRNECQIAGHARLGAGQRRHRLRGIHSTQQRDTDSDRRYYRQSVDQATSGRKLRMVGRRILLWMSADRVEAFHIHHSHHILQLAKPAQSIAGRWRDRTAVACTPGLVAGAKSEVVQGVGGNR